MTSVTWILLLMVAIQGALIVALWVRSARRDRLVRENEEFRHTAERAPVILWGSRPDGSLDYFNQTCVDFLGMPVEKLRNEGWQDAVHPDDRDPLIAVYTPAMEARQPFVVEYRARRADGVYRNILTTGVPRMASDGSYAGYVGCDLDITERKVAEDLTLQLAGRLIEAQDAERARMARDLHDDVSQQLAGLSIALSALKHRMDSAHVSDDLKADLRSVHQRTATLAENVRHVAHDLHPTVLRHAGLVTALTSYCAELQRTHGTTVTCSAEGDFSSVAPEVTLCLYRIAQEALRNVIAHADASRADVRLLRRDGTAEITVSDDGRGFDRALPRRKGLGLVSITERARFAGGTVSIEANAPKGTRVRATVPAPAIMSINTEDESGHRELYRS